MRPKYPLRPDALSPSSPSAHLYVRDAQGAASRREDLARRAVVGLPRRKNRLEMPEAPSEGVSAIAVLGQLPSSDFSMASTDQSPSFLKEANRTA